MFPGYLLVVRSGGTGELVGAEEDEEEEEGGGGGGGGGGRE